MCAFLCCYAEPKLGLDMLFGEERTLGNSTSGSFERKSDMGALASSASHGCSGPSASMKEASLPVSSFGGAAAEDDGVSAMTTKILGMVDAQQDASLVRIHRTQDDDLNSFSILHRVPMESKVELVANASRVNALNRAMGSMCGMAIGDSLGHNFEFQPAQDWPPSSSAPHFDLKTMRFHGESNAFYLRRGQWTDDASMGLCMADSLILKRHFDGSDMRVRFWCWWHRGYNNAFRKDSSRSASVGLGGNIAKSLNAISSCRGAPPASFDSPTEDAGNGSLMRFTPVALMLHAASPAELLETSRMSSYTTHPGIIAAEACSLLAFLIAKAVNLPEGPVNAKAFLDEGTAEYLEVSGLSKKSGWGYDQMKWLVTSKPVNKTETCWNWKSEHLDIAGTLRARGSRYNGYPVSAGYFGSYSLDGLALALWSVYHTTSFDEAVERSINLLGDADSHGSITGQLAGALYGYTSINGQFLEWLTAWDDNDFAVRAVLLHHLGSAKASPSSPPSSYSRAQVSSPYARGAPRSGHSVD